MVEGLTDLILRCWHRLGGYQVSPENPGLGFRLIKISEPLLLARWPKQDLWFSGGEFKIRRLPIFPHVGGSFIPSHSRRHAAEL